MFFKNNRLGIIWSLIIVGICVVPGKNLPATSFLDSLGVDKFIHAFFYLVLVNLVSKGLIKQANLSGSKIGVVSIAFLYSFLLGVGVEFFQSNFVVGRTGDLYDILANNIGAIIGAFIFIKSKQTNKLKV